jgi:two-component system, OmpR family, response regulator RegX3
VSSGDPQPRSGKPPNARRHRRTPGTALHSTANPDVLGPVYDDPRLAETLHVRDVELDPLAMRVTVRGATLPPLPPKEFALLHLLMLNAGRLCRRDALIARVWGLDHDRDSQTLNVHILRLRKKLEADPSQPTYIRTLRGVGYLFDT